MWRSFPIISRLWLQANFVLDSSVLFFIRLSHGRERTDDPAQEGATHSRAPGLGWSDVRAAAGRSVRWGVEARNGLRHSRPDGVEGTRGVRAGRVAGGRHRTASAPLQTNRPGRADAARVDRVCQGTGLGDEVMTDLTPQDRAPGAWLLTLSRLIFDDSVLNTVVRPT